MTGTVRVDAAHTEVHGATVVVRVLDVSRADAPSRPIAEVTLTGQALHAGARNEFPFDLEVDASDPSATYALAAHVDVDGSGEVTVGDYLTTEHIAVPSTEVANPVVAVRPVG